MDVEAPVDAWYVWLAVSLVSLGVGVVAIGLPAGPPPDAPQAANTIERTAGATTDASGTYEHDATRVKIDGTTVALRNEHGTTRASIAYGRVVPVMGHDSLERIAHGASLDDEYGGDDPDGAFLADLVDAHEETSGHWHTADGELAVRTLSLETESGPSVAVEGSTRKDEALSHRTASEVTVRYTAASATDLEIELTGSRFSGGETARERKTLPTDGSRRTEEVAIVDDEPDIATALDYPITVDVTTDGTLECSEELIGGGEFRTICDGGAVVGDTADAAARIADHAGGGEYRVTVVTA
ncbi:hypothetical protein RBH26_19985 [Natronolimnohabitans sp. A-GB9]|uniref:DUF7283 family protein n=1 Tax=Natronolimnohabitans sp. A-GB9 TaxID=3069757 RepID=UPI0027B3AA14|nr:hypothetical protein [Natronolimnohabitans sp. A-GB9]MDQ2052727.1 hypothetical protein [Natronolimnohabitans sp. A-GB9]